MTASELLSRLDAALRRTDEEVELSAEQMQRGMTRLAGSRVTQPGEVSDALVRARVARGRRVASARTSDLTEEGIARAIARAAELAMTQPERDDFVGFDAGTEPTPVLAGPAATPTEVEAAELRAAWAEQAISVIQRAGLVAAGCAVTNTIRHAVATRAGCRRAFDAADASLDLVAHENVSLAAASGRESFVGDFANLPDARALAGTASETALRAKDARALDPGRYDCLLEPPAVAELLEWLAITSLGAHSFEDGSSCLAGRIGERQFGPIDLYDDALSGVSGCPTLAFDAEGTPKRRFDLVSSGVGRAVVHDRSSAQRASVAPTGHAVGLADDVMDAGPQPMHLHLGEGDASREDLLGKIERGLVVKRFHYVNGLLDSRRGLMTGMTRMGLFLVENGKVVQAIRNLRWTESLLDALKRLDGVTRSRQVVSSSLAGAYCVCPTLLVRDWNFAAILSDGP